MIDSMNKMIFETLENSHGSKIFIFKTESFNSQSHLFIIYTLQTEGFGDEKDH